MSTGMQELMKAAKASVYDREKKVAALKSAKSEDDFAKALRTLVEWLPVAEQPDNAIVTHHGFYAAGCFLIADEALCLSYAMNKVIVVDMYLKYDDRHPTGRDEHYRAPSEKVWPRINEIIQANADVVDTWNGATNAPALCSTGSFRIRVDHSDALVRALNNYDHLLCSQEEHEQYAKSIKDKGGHVSKSCRLARGASAVFCNCPTRHAGFDALVTPEGWR